MVNSQVFKWLTSKTGLTLTTQTGPLPMLGRERDSLDHVTNEPNWKI